jgi:hypothetical protein
MGLSLIAVLRRHNVTICRISGIVQVFTAGTDDLIAHTASGAEMGPTQWAKSYVYCDLRRCEPV